LNTHYRREDADDDKDANSEQRKNCSGYRLTAASDSGRESPDLVALERFPGLLRLAQCVTGV
jgi:hypothetical protein